MPSTRRLSQDLSVSRNTVDLAYHQLASEGYIESRPRKGYFVETLDFSPITKVKRTKTSLEMNIDQERDRGRQIEGQIKYDFKYGMLSPEQLPTKQWQRLSNKCMKESRNNMAFYGPMFGERDLRIEIQKYLKPIEGSSAVLIKYLLVQGSITV